jgi:hypothetical protein
VEPVENDSGAASGLEVDDDPTVLRTSAWIERGQFVYFVTMARQLGDPADWLTFRDQLVSALKAAWGLDAIWLHLPPTGKRNVVRSASRPPTRASMRSAPATIRSPTGTSTSTRSGLPPAPLARTGLSLPRQSLGRLRRPPRRRASGEVPQNGLRPRHGVPGPINRRGPSCAGPWSWAVGCARLSLQGRSKSVAAENLSRICGDTRFDTSSATLLERGDRTVTSPPQAQLSCTTSSRPPTASSPAAREAPRTRHDRMGCCERAADARRRAASEMSSQSEIFRANPLHGHPLDMPISRGHGDRLGGPGQTSARAGRGPSPRP